MKRMIFYFKILRITKVFLHFQQIKQEEIEVGCRSGLRQCYCRIIIKQKKFEKYRTNRLKEIKINLALLVIKNYYQRNQLSFRVLMKRFKKYKRMLKNCKSSSVQNDLISTRDYYSVTSDIFSNNSSNENLKNPENIDLGNILECASLTSTEFLHQEKVRKAKIQNGLIAYNIPKVKEPIAVLPFLYQKDMIEELSPSRNYTAVTNSVVKRMVSNNPQRFSPIKRKTNLPLINFTPRVLPKSIVFTKDCLPNFTRPTASSSAGKREEESFHPLMAKGSFRESTTLFNQTFSGMQKITIPKKRSISTYKAMSPQTPRYSVYSRPEENLKFHYRAQTSVNQYSDNIDLPSLNNNQTGQRDERYKTIKQ